MLGHADPGVHRGPVLGTGGGRTACATRPPIPRLNSCGSVHARCTPAIRAVEADLLSRYRSFSLGLREPRCRSHMATHATSEVPPRTAPLHHPVGMANATGIATASQHTMTAIRNAVSDTVCNPYQVAAPQAAVMPTPTHGLATNEPATPATMHVTFTVVSVDPLLRAFCRSMHFCRAFFSAGHVA